MSAKWVAVVAVVAALRAGSASAQLYINGPLSTGPTSNSGAAAPGGTTWSEVQNDTGNLAESNTLSGVSCSSTATVFRCADDFTVPVGSPGWTVEAVIVYTYQTGYAGGTSPITAGTLRIFDRSPDDAGAVLLCGDTTTNVLASSTDAGMYRIFNSAVPPPGTTPGTARRIWRNELTVPAACAGVNFFQAGTYWIDWNTSIGGISSHFAPPVTITGVRGLPGWNALQDTGAGAYHAVVDGGNPGTATDVPLDFPFELMGPYLSLDECEDDLLIPTGNVSGSFMAGNSITTAGVVQVVGATRFRAPSIALGNGFSVASAVPFTAEATRPCFKDPGGVIPDNDPTGLTLTFSVAGLSHRLSRVSARLEMTHSYVGDLTARLISPGGVARLILLGRPGYRPSFAGGDSGVSADLNGVYIFDDFAARDFWATIAGLGGAAIIPSGVYRTSTAASRPAGSVLSNAGGCTTFLSGAFSGLTAAQANGTWTLQLVDAAGGDLGFVNAATLFLEESDSVSPNPIQGSPVRGVCTPARFDFTGTGRTSYAYVVDDGGSLRWKIVGNDGSPGGQPEQTFVFGLATGFFVPDDYDGDGIWDAAVWGPDPANPPSGQRFVIRRSSRPTDDLLVLPLGTLGDNPTVYGDYDGDRVADPSVLRAPFVTGSDVLFLSLHSTDGGAAVTQRVLTQTTTDFLRPFPGDDLTGDGIDDLAITRAGTWEVFDGFSGALFDTFSFANATDPVFEPGNFVGSERGDFTRVFVDGSNVKWQTRDGETGGLGAEIIHGSIGIGGFTEFVATGDFDGDGIDDYTVWRRDDTGSNSRFIIRQSSDLSVAEFFFGEPGAAPVPGAQAN